MKGAVRWRRWVAVCAWSVLTACARNTSGTSAALVSPPDSAALGRADVSSMAVIPVHVTYLLRALTPALDSVFPVRDSLSGPQCTNVVGLVCHQYVYRREPFVLSATGAQLAIRAPLAFRAQVGVRGTSRLASCGYAPEAMRRANVGMTTSLYWRRDWRIGARESALTATLLDPCVVTVLGVDATRSLSDLLNRQLATFAHQADTAIPRVADFGPLADSLWRSFLEPTALDSAGTLWLTLDPQGVRVTPLTGAGGTITTALVLYAAPRVVSGRRPALRSRPLPALALGDAPRTYTVPVHVELPFDEIERRAAALLAAETSSGSIRVDSVHIRGRGDSVTVALDVSGGLRGRLTLGSRLRWDAATRELRLDDLEWTLDSRGLLSGIKATLGAPLVRRAVRRATMGGRIPLGAQLDSVRLELMRKLNGPVAPGAVMGTSVSTFEIIGVGSTATAFVVRARLAGTAGVWFQ